MGRFGSGRSCGVVVRWLWSAGEVVVFLPVVVGRAGLACDVAAGRLGRRGREVAYGAFERGVALVKRRAWGLEERVDLLLSCFAGVHGILLE